MREEEETCRDEAGQDHDYLEKLRAHADQTRTFLSNKMKPERERSVCRAFLRTLGVSFNDNELIAPTVEPVDVAFREAQFQVRDLLRGRKRDDNWKEMEKQYKEAQHITDLFKPYSPPVPINLGSLMSEVTAALSGKAAKYGAGCTELDALVYVNLKDTFLKADSPAPNTEALQGQGWRSVSLLFPPYGVVLFAKVDAPSFLLNAAGTTSMEWVNPDGLFDA